MAITRYLLRGDPAADFEAVGGATGCGVGNGLGNKVESDLEPVPQ